MTGARPLQRRPVRGADVARVDVAPEVRLAQTRIGPLVGEPVVGVGRDDVVDPQPHPGGLRVADGERVGDHLAEVLAQRVRVRGRVPLGLVERDLARDLAVGEQAGRHLARGVDDPGHPEIAGRLHQVVRAQHVVVEDVDLGLAARGRVGREMADGVGAELEERVVDLAGVGQIDPAELGRQVELRLVGQVEVDHLVARFGQDPDHPLPGSSGSSGHHDAHVGFHPSALTGCYATAQSRHGRPSPDPAR